MGEAVSGVVECLVCDRAVVAPARRLRLKAVMRPDTIQAHIASRVAAIIITAFPLAALLYVTDVQDQDALQNLRTYEELRVHVESYLIGSYWACFAIVIMTGFAYVALIEGVAFLLRAFRPLMASRDQRAA